MQTDPKNVPIFDPTPQPEVLETTEPTPATVEDVPYVPPPRLSLKERQDQEAAAMRAEFTKQLLDLRNPPPIKPYTPPPLNERLQEQTRLEMEAGRARVAENEAQQAEARKLRAAQLAKKPDPVTTQNVEVFRPEDYVPNMDQGHTQARNLRGG